MNTDYHNRDQRTEPGAQPRDLLSELLRSKARELIAEAVEVEVQELLSTHRQQRDKQGRQAVVRNGYLPERRLVTGIGEVEVRVPKVRDRSGSGVKFNSRLLPPYLKRTQSVEEVLPWLYLKGVSTGDFSEALAALLGEQAAGLSAGTLSRLKAKWQDEHQAWQQRSLSEHRYVYIWADGVYFNIRADDRQCILVIIGVTAQGDKELLGMEAGCRESELSWKSLLLRLQDQGLQTAPALAIGDGALGFWKALSQVFPDTRHQRCWVHKTANVLNHLPKTQQPAAQSLLWEISRAATRTEAEQGLERFAATFEAKYPQAVACLVRDRQALLAFFDFPAEHWQHLRTTNPIESTFATVRLRTDKTRGCVSRATILALVFKLVQSAQQRWRRLRAAHLLPEVVAGVPFPDGVCSQPPASLSLDAA